jgi:hypothetical protein
MFKRVLKKVGRNNPLFLLRNKNPAPHHSPFSRGRLKGIPLMDGRTTHLQDLPQITPGPRAGTIRRIPETRPQPKDLFIKSTKNPTFPRQNKGLSPGN